VEKPRVTHSFLSGGYSSAWSADVNGEKKLKVENFSVEECSAMAALSGGEFFFANSVPSVLNRFRLKVKQGL
jgi:hypothetical protein